MMGQCHIAGFGGSSDGYIANAVDFNGSSDYLTRSGSVGSPNQLCLFSCWVRLDGGNASTMDILRLPNEVVKVYRDSSNKFHLSLRRSDSTIIYEANSTNSYTSGSSWIHVLMSCDLQDGSAALKHIYINGSSDKTLVTDPNLGSNIAYGVNDTTSVAANQIGGNPLNGCISELYFTNYYLDLSVQANREKFRSAAGKPVDLGSNGSLPTGSQPLIYLKNPAASVNVNSGTISNFTINGSPATASTSPSN